MLKIRQANPTRFSKRSGHISVSVGRYMLVWGGYSSRDSEDRDGYLSSQIVALYDTETCHWTKETTKLHNNHPASTSGAKGVVLDNYLYIFGGHCSRTGHTNYMARLLLTPDDLQWEPVYPVNKKPSPRDKFCMWTYQKKIYCFGGFGPAINGEPRWLKTHGYYEPEGTIYEWLGWNNQLLIFDPDCSEWQNPQCKGDVPTPRAAHASAAIGNRVYLFGGRHKSTRLNDLFMLDLDTLTWYRMHPEQNGEIPAGRSWHSLTAMSDTKLVLYGGYSQNEEPFSDAWILDVRLPEWRKIQVPNTWPRIWHSACVVDDGAVLIYGGCSHNICDDTQESEHRDEILELRISPKSLLGLSLDAVFEFRECTKSDWVTLPKPLRDKLQTRFNSWVEVYFPGMEPPQKSNSRAYSCTMS